MKQIELKPIVEKKEDYEAIEARIKRIFQEEIYKPLLREFNASTKAIRNATDSLLEALRTGRVTYHRGTFSGDFNSSVSSDLRQLGAKFDRKSGTFKLPLEKFGQQLREAVSVSEYRFNEKMARIDTLLSKVVPEELSKKMKLEGLFDQTIFRVNQEYKKSVKGVTIAPELTPERRARIAKEWTENMDLWIKDFTEKEIIQLRKYMQKSYFEGNRYGSAVQYIKKSYGVTERKAKFLARQETMLLGTKFKQMRYEDAGIRYYKWKAVPGTALHPTREMHKKLSERSDKGELFRFDNPPVDDPNGTRHNPGENFNCRCRAIPVIRF